MIIWKVNMIDILNKANEAIGTAEHKVDETAHAANDKASELKHEAGDAAHDAKEKVKGTAENVQGYLFINLYLLYLYQKYF